MDRIKIEPIQNIEELDKYYSLISFYLQNSSLEEFKKKWNENANKNLQNKLTLKENLKSFLKENYNLNISELINPDNLVDGKLKISAPVPSHHKNKFIYHVPIKNNERPQAWLYDEDTGIHQKITDNGAALSFTKPFWSDNDSMYFYNTDPNHDEKYQIFSYNLQTNKTEQLTNDNDVNNLVGMINDDELLVYKNSSSDYQFFSFSLKNKTFNQLTNIKGGIQTTAGITVQFLDLLSKDKNKFVFPHNNALWLYDFNTKETKEIYKMDNTILTPTQWNPNNKEIFFESNHLDKNIIGSFDITTNNVKWIGNNDYENSFGIATDKNLFLTIFKDGSNKLVKYDLAGNYLNEIPLDGSVFGLMYNKQDKLLLKTSSFDFETKFLSIDEDSIEFEPYLKVYNQNFPNSRINYEYLTIPSHDTKVSTFLLKPTNFDPNKKYPSIFVFHGGPYSHFSNQYDATLKKLLDFGFVVLLPNPSGSTGYGRDFNKRITISNDQINMGKKDVEDIDNIVEHISNLPYIQKENITMMGASYGGYLTWMYALKGKFRQNVKKIIPALSISSFEIFTEFKDNPILRHIVQAFVLENLLPDVINVKDEKTKEKYQEMLKEASPLTYIKNLNANCMMIQSGTDNRTPRTHTDAIMNELKNLYKDKMPFDLQYEILEGYGHNIFSADTLQKIAMFLMKN